MRFHALIVVFVVTQQIFVAQFPHCRVVDDAQEIIHLTDQLVAPVAWALFMEKSTWDEWLFASEGDGIVLDKGQQLTTFTQQGRCVLMGSQTVHNVETF